jgi:uncharacterized protein YjbJ (UPF0337 family)
MKKSTHDRIEGSAKQVRGKAKVAAGKVTGNSRTKMKGYVDQLDGRLQKQAGRNAKARGR